MSYVWLPRLNSWLAGHSSGIAKHCSQNHVVYSHTFNKLAVIMWVFQALSPASQILSQLWCMWLPTRVTSEASRLCTFCPWGLSHNLTREFKRHGDACTPDQLLKPECCAAVSWCWALVGDRLPSHWIRILVNLWRQMATWRFHRQERYIASMKATHQYGTSLPGSEPSVLLCKMSSPW